MRSTASKGRFQEQHRRVQARLEAIYEDRLEGRISSETYDRKAAELRLQSLELLRKINDTRSAAPAPVQDAINLMDLTSRAAELFLLQPTDEKQTLPPARLEICVLAG